MTKRTIRYREEFKSEAVKSIAEHNGNITAAARKLGIPIQISKPISESLVLLECVLF